VTLRLHETREFISVRLLLSPPTKHTKGIAPHGDDDRKERIISSWHKSVQVYVDGATLEPIARVYVMSFPSQRQSTAMQRPPNYVDKVYVNDIYQKCEFSLAPDTQKMRKRVF